MEEKLIQLLPFIIVVTAVVFTIIGIGLSGYSAKNPDASKRWFNRLQKMKWTLFAVVAGYIVIRFVWLFI
ncbi:hypothetical protein A8L34_28130 [Bacillus sp. FJAT-27264]|uniref:hypothetical protein n=1 Tax=Paenibacillus sp. (strain DSM 101736 / FJAT-27264) TaxID=1850362 RepID=UPI000807CA87|nr:hypothetical protein [Bacillus sp. FJAT-27264]OBZ15917.1 hypothetical protein A8L34_28130 [Bacillus sp. FJAT-27264]